MVSVQWNKEVEDAVIKECSRSYTKGDLGSVGKKVYRLEKGKGLLQIMMGFRE